MHTLRVEITVLMDGRKPKQQKWDIRASDPKENVKLSDVVDKSREFMSVCALSFANILAAMEKNVPGIADKMLAAFTQDVKTFMKGVRPVDSREAETDPKKN